MEKQKYSFAVDASQIDIKPLLNKEFLELSMRAVSDANPNRNNSWFTLESMEKGLKTFKNKPILGYFENGDFVSHNGEWQTDQETDLDYWDTLGQKGERILGLIRDEDEVKIVQDSKGLSWICLTCALWTQYSFKQVKRLLKDAKKAKENGGAAKNISVEVDITDYEMLPNGVMKIKDFNLVGITILGSRNGIKVEPGIENAELSVVDIMGNKFFERQEKALRLAYEKLDNSQQESKKEDYSQVDEVENKEQVSVESTSVEEAEKQEFAEAESEVCPECGENPCVCEKQAEEEAECEEKAECEEQTEDNCKMEEDKSTEDCEEKAESECKMADDEDNDESDEDDEAEEDENAKCAEDQNCKMSNEEQSQETIPVEENSEPEKFDTQGETMVIADLAYVLRQFNELISGLDASERYYSGDWVSEELIENKETIVAFLGRLKNCAAECLQEVADMIANMAGKLTDEVKMYEQEISQYTLKSLFNQFKAVKAEKDELAAKFEEIERQEFLKEAKELINSVANLEEEKGNEFYRQCESAEISTIDELKIKIAMAVTFSETNININTTKKETDTYDAPICAPEIQTLSSKAEKAGKSDKWDALHSVIGK